MAVDDGNLDIGDFEDLFSNNSEKEYCGWLSPSSFGESEPYVPPLSLRDLEWWLLNSPDDFPSFNDVGLMPEYQSCCFSSPEGREGNKATREDESLLQGLTGFTGKKGRTRKYLKPRGRVIWARKRCSHCQTDKTPMWRAGPIGPKTLCNACGVRFKSGRLVPEYRPATSPTFDSRMHSNYHKNVLKLRSSS